MYCGSLRGRWYKPSLSFRGLTLKPLSSSDIRTEAFRGSSCSGLRLRLFEPAAAVMNSGQATTRFFERLGLTRIPGEGREAMPFGFENRRVGFSLPALASL